MSRWLSVVGIGEDGLDGLAPAARATIEAAEVLVGGARHLAHVPEGDAERLTWAAGFAETFDLIEQHRGHPVVVLASGDPLFFGVGAKLADRFSMDEMTVLPAPGAFSLAAARLGWSLPDAALLTVHGRPVEALARHLFPDARLLILAADGESPGAVASLLVDHGFGPSPMSVFEHMGGAEEKRLDGTAAGWPPADRPNGPAADLNTIAVECVAGDGAKALSTVPGLPDDAFEHDGQITKREVRAATIAALAPLPGQVLWDLGAGSGAVAIEWMRAVDHARAVAVERNPERLAAIGRNAATLGVPALRVVEGDIAEVIGTLAPPPDAIFLGGGVSVPGLLEACWGALEPGGRLVANGVTVEAQARLMDFHKRNGGALIRMGVARAAPVGSLSGFKPLMEVMQFAATKGKLNADG